MDTDYTLTYTVAGSGGTISVPGGENGSVTVSHGGSITFTAAPDQYYHVNEWMVDGEPVTEGVSADRTTLTLTNVTAAHTIAVSFTGAVRYDVNYAVEGSGGTVSATANGESIASDTTVQVLGGSKLGADVREPLNQAVDKGLDEAGGIPELADLVDLQFAL